jgi:mRNA interferase MazF
MVDKLTTVSRERLGSRVGQLDVEKTARLNQAMLVFLGLARPPRAAS